MAIAFYGPEKRELTSVKSSRKFTKLPITATINKDLLYYVPREYRKLVVDIYKGEKIWNDLTNRWNVPIIVEWENGEVSEFQNANYMTNVLKEFHSPDEYQASLEGQRVKILSGYLAGEWGLVRSYDGEYYHVSPYGADNEALVFERNEIQPITDNP